MGAKPRVAATASDEAELAGWCARVENRDANDTATEALVRAIRSGADPLGTAFCHLRSPRERRHSGATYTPPAIVDAMVAWAEQNGEPVRVVDPGAGSGRFLMRAARAFPRARLVGIERDPLAAAIARANAAAAGFAARCDILCADYREVRLPDAHGPTLFIGNPPYVRHHRLARRWKLWLRETAARHGLDASGLAGLHVHFFLATAEHARPGDFGAFITASEWLDVNYGALVRALLAGPLGLVRLDLLAPQLAAFADAHTTAVISCFRPGETTAPARVRRIDHIDQLRPLAGGRAIGRRTLATGQRWSQLGRRASHRPDHIELGELCRVHRGQVTGANRVWIAGAATPELPRRFLRSTITRARELFESAGALRSATHLRRVVDLPEDLTSLNPRERRQVDAFLAWAQRAGAHERYVARHRNPWWAVKLYAPAPILATYMARRPPAFVRNRIGARHINIAHGLYPRDELSPACLDALATYLACSVSTDDGRTYAGGLTKYEPREMERLLVPTPAVLEQMASQACIRAGPRR